MLIIHCSKQCWESSYVSSFLTRAAFSFTASTSEIFSLLKQIWPWRMDKCQTVPVQENKTDGLIARISWWSIRFRLPIFSIFYSVFNVSGSPRCEASSKSYQHFWKSLNHSKTRARDTHSLPYLNKRWDSVAVFSSFV